jgi:hypothetical protein
MAEGQLVVLNKAVADPLRRHQRPSLDRYLLFVGHPRARKQVTEFLQALASPGVTQRRRRATVTGGAPVNEFYRLARELGIPDWTHLPGWIDTASVSRLCAAADVLVPPSLPRGAGHVSARGDVSRAGSDHDTAPRSVGSSRPQRVRTAGITRERRARVRERLLHGFNVRAYTTRLENVHRALLARRPAIPIGLEQLS